MSTTPNTPNVPSKKNKQTQKSSQSRELRSVRPRDPSLQNRPEVTKGPHESHEQNDHSRKEEKNPNLFTALALPRALEAMGTLLQGLFGLLFLYKGDESVKSK